MFQFVKNAIAAVMLGTSEMQQTFSDPSPTEPFRQIKQYGRIDLGQSPLTNQRDKMASLLVKHCLEHNTTILNYVFMAGTEKDISTAGFKEILYKVKDNDKIYRLDEVQCKVVNKELSKMIKDLNYMPEGESDATLKYIIADMEKDI